MKRGVIATPAIFGESKKNSVAIERQVSPEEMRYYALYWDVITIPCNSMIYLALPDEGELIEAGVLQRPVITHPNGMISNNNFLNEQILTAKNLIGRDKDIDWVIHQIGDKLVLPNSETKTLQSLRFSLINSLPVPSSDTHISDILDFKNRRRDELQRLHISIEDAYLAAIASPDQQLAGNRAIEELKKTINDLNKVSSEKWAHTKKYDFSVSFNLDGGKLLGGATAASIISSMTNVAPIQVGMVIGALVSMLRLSVSRSSSLSCTSNQSVLAYLSNAQKENVLS